MTQPDRETEGGAMSRIRLTAAASLLALAGVACGGTSTPSSTGSTPPASSPASSLASTNAVSMTDSLKFEPQAITVTAGTEVTWTSGTVPHTVTANDGSFDSGNIEAKKTYKRTFDKAGTFDYYCKLHGKTTMFGSVTVTA